MEDFSTKGWEDWYLNSSFMWRELELAGTRVSRDQQAPQAHLWASAPFPHYFYPKEKCDLEMARGQYGQPSMGARLGVPDSLSSSETAAEGGLRCDKYSISS